MADETKILGDIDPEPQAHDRLGRKERSTESEEPDTSDDRSMDGGSNEDRTQHSGSRDVTEGTTGGTGAEVGGTRNYRTGTGATGTDIGGRPE
ncbi:MAG TPA: hypothetical protein VJP86_07590 [Vicinamibacterales bacterium]|jgi:hypothetical protein|nr:hypothetical protein [Vicinamibacterales bacterium]